MSSSLFNVIRYEFGKHCNFPPNDNRFLNCVPNVINFDLIFYPC